VRGPRRKQTRSLRVLVAEDNPTNQKLVVALLKQQGHRVSMVGNGRLAVEQSAKQRFDVILMDVQMPEMGGFEATAAIRERERTTGTRTPIVALTAHAMAGDRERCLVAGMDGYISKPLRPDELFSTIDLMVPSGGKASPTEGSRPSTTGRVDLATLLANFGGRAEVVAGVIDVFLEDAPNMLARLKQAAAAKNVAELAAAAHAIKGAVGLFLMGYAYESARRLEQYARDGDLSELDAGYADVEGGVSRLMAELRGIRRVI
jgi:CheY-like chemotaxis protein